MNENIDLIAILQDCPKGTKLYSTICGEVQLDHIENDEYPIVVEAATGYQFRLAQDGRYFSDFDGECTLFPSKDQRDWSKFKLKKERFDPSTLKPFDKVLVRDYYIDKWVGSIFSHIEPEDDFHYVCILDSTWRYCIPYNDETKHLIGTTNNAPESYRYWKS